MDSKISFPKICILTDSFYPRVGGSEIHARLLGDELVRNGYPVFVLTRRFNRNLQREEMIGKLPVFRVSPSGFKRFGKYFMILPSFITIIRKHRDYDIIYVCGLRVLGVLGIFVASCLNKKCILRSESCNELDGEYIKGAFKRSILSAIASFCVNFRNAYLKKAHSFIAISNVIREEYLACNVPTDKIKLIPNGIDTTKFSPATDQEKQYLRNKLDLPDKIIFSYSGKLNRGKGLELLLRVCRDIVRKYPQVHLLLIGSGGDQFLSCEGELKQFVKKEAMQNYVTFTGYVNNVMDFLKASDFFILPSESEAHPISLLEALSCGLPSIGTKAGGINDVLIDGVNGRMIEIDDATALLSVMAEFVEDPERTKNLGEEGRKTVLEKYGISETTIKHQEHFIALQQY